MLRKANAFLIELPPQPGQAHRSAAGALIDYKLQEVTDSSVRAISTVPGNFVDKPAFKSPWHYHDCDMQIAVILDGSVELGYRGDTYARAERGDILFIPGQTMHDVGAPSADYQIAEITFPGTFGTVEAPQPARDAVTPAVTLGARDAIRGDTVNGITEYRHAIAEPYSKRYSIRRMLRSRTEPFAPSEQWHGQKQRMIVVTAGWRQLASGERCERGDLLLVPGGERVRDTAVSDDYAAVEVTLL